MQNASEGLRRVPHPAQTLPAALTAGVETPASTWPTGVAIEALSEASSCSLLTKNVMSDSFILCFTKIQAVDRSPHGGNNIPNSISRLLVLLSFLTVSNAGG